MDIANTIFRILGSILVPIAVSILVYLAVTRLKPFKNMNFFLREILIGIVFGALSIVGFYLGVGIKYTTPKGIEAVVTFGTTALAPYLAALLFSYPSAIVSAAIGATFRGLQFDSINIPVMLAILFSALVGILSKVFIFRNKKPRWYYACLGIVVVECFNNLMIFAFSSSGYRGAYSIVNISDIVCVVVEIVTIAIIFIGINLLDKQKFNLTVNHIATKVQRSLFISSLAILICLATSSFLIMRNKSQSESVADIAANCNGLRNDADTLAAYRLDSQIHNLADNRHIQTSGFSIIVMLQDKSSTELPGHTDFAGDIISCKIDKWNEVGASTNPPLPSERVQFAANGGLPIQAFFRYISLDDAGAITFNIKFDNSPTKTEYLATFMSCTNGIYGIMSFISLDEISLNARFSTRLLLYGEIIAIIILYAIINICIDRIIVSKIYRVNDSLEKIMEGNLDETIDVGDTVEFKLLSEDINLTVGSLKNLANEVERRIDDELILASNIQHSSVPSIFPIAKNYDIYAMMHTAKEVGGDFYDFLLMSNNRILFLIADVSGKGISAAMFMMRAKTYIKSLAATNAPLSEIVERTNDELCSENEPGFFVTAWFGILNYETGELEYANCGHCPPLLYINGKYEFLTTKANFVLAGMPGLRIKSEKFQLNPGDSIMIYTDGVTEATDANKELFGNDRLLASISKNKSFTSRQLCEMIFEDVNKFSNGVDQADDITILNLRFFGPKGEDIDANRELELPATLDNITIAKNFVNSHVIKHGGSNKMEKETAMVIDEVFANIVKFAHKEKPGTIKMRIDIKNDVLIISISDDGVAYNPCGSNASRMTSDKEDFDEKSISALIIKRNVDDFTYRRHNNTNISVISKSFKKNK